MVHACNVAQTITNPQTGKPFSRGWLVNLAGGNAGTNPIYSAHFTVLICTGKIKKFLPAQCIQAMQAIAAGKPLPKFIPVVINGVTIA
jgi:hypothetical protein